MCECVSVRNVPVIMCAAVGAVIDHAPNLLGLVLGLVSVLALVLALVLVLASALRLVIVIC